MITLSTSLRAHQRGSGRVPAVRVTFSTERGRVTVPRWRALSAASVAAGQPHALAIAGNGNAVRVRNNGGTIQAFSAPVSSASNWAGYGTLATGATSGTGVAVCARTGEVLAAWIAGTTSRSVRVAVSTDNGATWGAAVTVASGLSSAVTVIAAAMRSNGNACLFFNNGTGTVTRLRRTGGTWGTAANHPSPPGTVTGLAAVHDGADYQVLVTGTESATVAPRVYGFVLGDGGFAVDSWGALNAVVAADAGSTAQFLTPALVVANSTAYAWYQHRDTTTSYGWRRTFATRATPGSGVNAANAWLDPEPHEHEEDAAGVAVARSGATWVMAGSGRPGTTGGTTVWVAEAASHDLSARLVSASCANGPRGQRAVLTFDNADGALLDAADVPALSTGCTVTVEPGYASGAGGAPEYGVAWRYTVDRVRHEAGDGQRRVVVEGSGPWEALARWRSGSAFQTASGGLTRGEIVQALTAASGYQTLTGAVSATWTGWRPAFAYGPGESGETLVERVLAFATDHLSAEDGSFRARDLLAAEASSETYGEGGHPVAALSLWAAAGPATWVRVSGSGRYAQAVDGAGVAATGSRLRQLRTWETNQNTAAANALRRARLADTLGELRCPAHAGQQLFDVITVSEPRLGVAAVRCRVAGVALEYERGPRARFESILTLGEV